MIIFRILINHIIGWWHLGIVLGRKFDNYRRAALLDDVAMVQELLIHKFMEEKEIDFEF